MTSRAKKARFKNIHAGIVGLWLISWQDLLKTDTEKTLLIIVLNYKIVMSKVFTASVFT